MPDTDNRYDNLQNRLGAYFGGIALAMVLATVVGVWLQPPGAPVHIVDPDALVARGCAKPIQPDEEPDYVGVPCADEAATVMVLDLVSPPEHGDPVCPHGTDQIINVWTPPRQQSDDTPIENDEEREISEIICARNLYPPHPGDQGAGGGLLVTGDCVAMLSSGARETPCNGTGDRAAEYKVLDVVVDPSDCPDTTESELVKDTRLELGEPGYQTVCAIGLPDSTD